MKIKELSLTNFRRFEQLDLKLPDSNFIILIGENGCGKSSVLDAVAVGLLHTIKCLARIEDISNYLTHDDINSGNINAQIKVKALDKTLGKINFSNSFSINNTYQSEFDRSSKLQTIDARLEGKSMTNLPLIVYYQLNRTYIEKKIIRRESIFYRKILEGYKYAFDKNISSLQEFENWFIIQENIENEQKINTKNLDFEVISLKIIRKVVIEFLNEINTKEFTNLRVRRVSESNLQFSNQTNQGELVIQKSGKEVKIKQLSSGEKMILLLVCDIARRLLILNSMDENCLEGEGVVLIDEIEMHLHPKWQRRIIPALRKVFPNIQFIATTHSPQVLSNLSDNEIIVLDGDSYYSPATNPYGRDSNGILEEIFGTTERPFEADKLVDEIFDILSNGQHEIPKAETKLVELRGHLGAQDPILLRIENLINRKKILTQ